MQRYLEASMVLAWTEVTWLRRSAGRESPSFIAATHPTGDGLTITLSDVAYVGPLLGRILPVRDGDLVTGISGLRIYLGRNHLELRLLSPRNNRRARVRLLGASRARFRHLLGELTGGYPDQRPLMSTRHVDDGELPMFGGPKLTAAPLLSGILRRISLWRTASGLVISANGSWARVEWHGDPPARTLAAILGQSTCAVPQVEVTASTTGVSHRIDITSRRGSATTDATEPTDAWETIHDIQAGAAGKPAVAPRLTEVMVPVQLWGTPDMCAALARGSSPPCSGCCAVPVLPRPRSRR